MDFWQAYYCYFKFVASKDNIQFQMAFFGMHTALQEFANMLVAVGDLHQFLALATDCCREHKELRYFGYFFARLDVYQSGSSCKNVLDVVFVFT